MFLLSTKVALPLIVLMTTIAALAGAPSKQTARAAASELAASEYASMPHVVIVAKRLTREQKLQQIAQERMELFPRLSAR